MRERERERARLRIRDKACEELALREGPNRFAVENGSLWIVKLRFQLMLFSFNGAGGFLVLREGLCKRL